MGHYLSVYQSGEGNRVWQDLLAAGEDVQREPLLSEALAVTQEIVERVVINAELLIVRLISLGYQFRSNPPLVLADGDPRQLIEVEAQLGRLPLLLRTWYSRISRLDFTQAPGQLYGLEGPSPVAGLGLNTPLQCCDLNECLELHQQLVLDEANNLSNSRWTRFLPLGGSASNCDPRGVSLPCAAFDAAIYNAGAGPVYFYEEIRHGFQYGGFPFWHQHLVEHQQRSAPVKWMPDYARVLPQLTEGLKEI